MSVTAAPLTACTREEHEWCEILDCVRAAWDLADAFSLSSDVDTPPFYTHFHSASVPRVSLPQYVAGVSHRLELCPSVLPVALVLVQRYWSQSSHRPSRLTVHRLFAAALVIAAKFQMDFRVGSDDAAAACGLPLTEIILLERLFLQHIEYRVFTSIEDVERLLGPLRPARDAYITLIAHAFAVHSPPIACVAPSHKSALTITAGNSADTDSSDELLTDEAVGMCAPQDASITTPPVPSL